MPHPASRSARVAAALLLSAAATLAAAPGAEAQQAPPPFAAFDGASAPILNDPHDLTLGPDGRLYVADKFGGRVVILDPETLEQVGEFGDGMLFQVRDVSFTPEGHAVLAVTGLGEVQVYDLSRDPPALIRRLPAPGTEGALAHSSGRVFAMVGAACAIAGFDGDAVAVMSRIPCGGHDIAEGPDGTLWVPDMQGDRVLRFSADLQLLGWIGGAGSGLIGPRYAAVDPLGRVAVADQDGHQVVLFDPAAGEHGAVIGVLGDGAPGMGPGKFDDPEGGASDGARWFISDSDNNRVVRYSVVVN